MSNQNTYKIQYTRPLLSVQDIVRYIDKGEEYIKSQEVFNSLDSMEYLGAIILNPTYQREYRSSLKEESLIVESILLNIPIPEIFLVRVPKNTIQLRNVMDGRHRLNAIYRFIKGKYRLQGLTLIEKYSQANSYSYNGKSFADLSDEDKIRILTYKISVLEFDELSDDDIERELFTRYNKATKPLEAQEIRYATYYSKTSLYVTNFIKKLKDDKHNKLNTIYNITKTRRDRQKVHQNIFVILHTIEKGLNVKLSKSTEVADEYMKQKSLEYKNNVETGIVENLFNEFNSLILQISVIKEYPFSSRIYTDKTGSGSYLFQTGIAMAISSLFYYCSIEIDDQFEFVEDISKCITDMVSDNKVYSGCPTNSKIIADNIIKISTNTYQHIRFDSNKISELKQELAEHEVKTLEDK